MGFCSSNLPIFYEVRRLRALIRSKKRRRFMLGARNLSTYSVQMHNL